MCIPGCSSETCDDIGKTNECAIQPAICRTGCRCKPGFWRNKDDKCVPESQCRKYQFGVCFCYVLSFVVCVVRCPLLSLRFPHRHRLLVGSSSRPTGTRCFKYPGPFPISLIDHLSSACQSVVSIRKPSGFNGHLISVVSS